MIKRRLKLLVFSIALLLIGSLLMALPTRHASAQKEQQQIESAPQRVGPAIFNKIVVYYLDVIYKVHNREVGKGENQ